MNRSRQSADPEFWFTASDLERMALPGLPKFQRSIRSKAKYEEWTSRVRKEAAEFYLEFPFSALPKETRSAYIKKYGRKEPNHLSYEQVCVIGARIYILDQVEAMRRVICRMRNWSDNGRKGRSIAERHFSEAIRLNMAPEIVVVMLNIAIQKPRDEFESRPISPKTLKTWQNNRKIGGDVALAPLRPRPI